MPELIPQLSDVESLKEYLTSLALEDCVRVAAMLNDATLRGWLTNLADVATAKLTENSTYEQVAVLLGVSKGMVNRRVSRHNHRQQVQRRIEALGDMF